MDNRIRVYQGYQVTVRVAPWDPNPARRMTIQGLGTDYVSGFARHAVLRFPDASSPWGMDRLETDTLRICDGDVYRFSRQLTHAGWCLVSGDVYMAGGRAWQVLDIGVVTIHGEGWTHRHEIGWSSAGTHTARREHRIEVRVELEHRKAAYALGIQGNPEELELAITKAVQRAEVRYLHEGASRAGDF